RQTWSRYRLSVRARPAVSSPAIRRQERSGRVIEILNEQRLRGRARDQCRREQAGRDESRKSRASFPSNPRLLHDTSGQWLKVIQNVFHECRIERGVRLTIAGAGRIYGHTSRKAPGLEQGKWGWLLDDVGPSTLPSLGGATAHTAARGCPLLGGRAVRRRDLSG